VTPWRTFVHLAVSPPGAARRPVLVDHLEGVDLTVVHLDGVDVVVRAAAKQDGSQE